ncbi:fas apoptotic inhibitory molecule 1 [Lycorma delicatula]|uniref:fas apoptotic inhibitory molecule 1 n=1 Tax=Lycorma delicatula TaxID=130591 RepID=UPI003F519C69
MLVGLTRGSFFEAQGYFFETNTSPTDEKMAGSSGDLVALWDVPLSDSVHHVEFEHGTATGKRVLRVDGKEILRKDWMFKLVGDEPFNIGKTKCVVRVEPSGGFSYEYSLVVDGKSLEKFTENQSKTCCTWLVQLPDNLYRVVLEKDTLDIWANGQKLEATGEFVEDGTETHFHLGDIPAYIKAVTSCNKREGLIHSLIVQNEIIPPEN